MGKISALSKRPGEIPRHVWVSNRLEALQKAVDGYIQTVGLKDDMVIICNEEGVLLGMEYNCTIEGCSFVGPILIVGITEDEDGKQDFADLPCTWGEMKDEFPELWEVKNHADH